jgi:hypothetical protein
VAERVCAAFDVVAATWAGRDEGKCAPGTPPSLDDAQGVTVRLSAAQMRRLDAAGWVAGEGALGEWLVRAAEADRGEPVAYAVMIGDRVLSLWPPEMGYHLTIDRCRDLAAAACASSTAGAEVVALYR